MSILPALALCITPFSSLTAQPVCVTAVPIHQQNAPVLANEQLATVVGAHNGLTRRTFDALSEAQARADIRTVLDAGGLAMDVWWGSIGSAMIAENVRNAQGTIGR